MKEFYRQTTEEAMTSLKVTKEGLHTDEVQKRRQQYGWNELDEAERITFIGVFFRQFKDFLVFILIVAAVISAFLGKVESTIVILIVVIINAILGTVQHMKAEKSLKSLKALSAPTAKVYRNGQKQEIPSKELVPGDILYLDAGDYVSGDGRILEAHSLQVNESSLTGESESVLKLTEPIDKENIVIGDRKNMVFSGSFVTYGRGVVLVTGTGMKTEIGRIATLMETAQEKKTPLQQNLDNFGKKLAILIIILSILIFGLDVIRGREVIDSFMFAVSLAVAAIPEALSSIVTIVLAIGTQKMAKENAIIRHLHAVESLGSISVICSDKTGTLTENKMTVKKVWVDGQEKQHDQLDMDREMDRMLVSMSLLCNDAVTIENKEIGDPTEIALVNLGEVYNLDELDVRENFTRLGEVPFDSERKLMSTANKVQGKLYMLTKGAPDVILTRIERVSTSAGIIQLTSEDKEEIDNAYRKFSSEGLRVLGFAYKELADNPKISVEDEHDLIFAGFIAMVDPPRAESLAAVESCINAGIKPVMITGDHKITASAIARQVGILKQDGDAIEGAELERMSDEELRERVANTSVYARVSPEHKIRIVRAWQKLGHVVAMTGDGVNDAPALKQADIGIAMGITGTEVAKDAASMVLTDDNFSTIVKAINNGRSIFANIKNSIKFLLSGNTAGILSVLYASLGALPVPFAPVHLLFINLLTDSLPAIAVGLEPHNKNVMNEKPRDINTPILNKSFATEIVCEGIIIAIATIAAFHIGLADSNAVASTMAFTTLCGARLLHGFNSRSKQSIFKIGLFSNKMVWLAVLVGIALLNIVLWFPPLMKVFEIATLSGEQYLTIIGLSLIPLVTIQLYKLIFVK
ncbi:cation-translocating P-type ATPase [Bacillus marasmi]|uniref:cation-translocating P-type ATPase n=1 Tax=Bacillus marasmi TaxID=1926279 RepID=UPI0011C9CE29|nr:cation-translocating P-type ATPase [Bacillus marasmi]